MVTSTSRSPGPRTGIAPAPFHPASRTRRGVHNWNSGPSEAFFRRFFGWDGDDWWWLKLWFFMVETIVFDDSTTGVDGWVTYITYVYPWRDGMGHPFIVFSMMGWDFGLGVEKCQKRWFFLRKIIHSWVWFGVMKHEWMGFDKPSQNIPKHPGSLVWDGVTGWSDEDFLQQNQSMQRRGLGHANTISGTGWTEDVIIYHLIDLIYDIPWFLLN